MLYVSGKAKVKSDIYIGNNIMCDATYHSIIPYNPSGYYNNGYFIKSSGHLIDFSGGFRYLENGNWFCGEYCCVLYDNKGYVFNGMNFSKTNKLYCNGTPYDGNYNNLEYLEGIPYNGTYNNFYYINGIKLLNSDIGVTYNNFYYINGIKVISNGCYNGYNYINGVKQL
jgi:hypothetical protein